MNFHEKLIQLRKKEGLSQEELGERLGVSRQTVSKWELGQSYPDFQRLVGISDYFGLSLDELVRDVDVQDVRDQTKKQLSQIYEDIQTAKRAGNLLLNILAGFGIIGLLFFVLLGIFCGG